MKIRACVLLFQEDQILTLCYNYNQNEVYTLPGGNLEFGEYISDCLIRELKEELYLDIKLENFVAVGEVIDDQKHTIHFIFKGTIISGEPMLNPKETSARSFNWLPVSCIDQYNIYPNVKDLIKSVHVSKPVNPFLGKIDQKWF
jgi:ADP-ribose pyrophosphatase YjhB (NUDIX family)